MIDTDRRDVEVDRRAREDARQRPALLAAPEPMATERGRSGPLFAVRWAPRPAWRRAGQPPLARRGRGPGPLDGPEPAPRRSPAGRVADLPASRATRRRGGAGRRPARSRSASSSSASPCRRGLSWTCAATRPKQSTDSRDLRRGAGRRRCAGGLCCATGRLGALGRPLTFESATAAAEKDATAATQPSRSAGSISTPLAGFGRR